MWHPNSTDQTNSARGKRETAPIWLNRRNGGLRFLEVAQSICCLGPKDTRNGICSRGAPNAVELRTTLLSMKQPTSFRRKPESSLFGQFWTPAFENVSQSTAFRIPPFFKGGQEGF
jgi:hypothetical protein